jgi:hypothetical protein
MAEIEARFATSDHRVWLFHGIAQVVEALRWAGCRMMYLNGSYITAKDHPADFDGCWEPGGVDGSKLDPVLLDFTNGRAAQKQKYRGEMFICSLANGAVGTFLEFIQVEKHTGATKGIVAVRLDMNEGTGS